MLRYVNIGSTKGCTVFVCLNAQTRKVLTKNMEALLNIVNGKLHRASFYSLLTKINTKDNKILTKKVTRYRAT